MAHIFAVLFSVLAYFFTKWVMPIFDTHFFEFFQAAVVLSAWYGGRGPGMVAAILSAVIIDYFFIHPIHGFYAGSTDFLRLGLFVAVAFLTSSLSGKLKHAYVELERAHKKLEQANDELEIRIEKRTSELSDANLFLKQEISHRLEAEQAILDITNREQRRLGQDLHDGLSQVLAGIKLMTERVKQTLLKKSDEESGKVAMIESRLSEALAYVDHVSRGLYPVELETNGLMAALEELSNNISKVHQVRCRFICWKPVDIINSGAVANHVYRIAHEAVMNALKSGKATKINIKLMQFRDKIILRVSDNGVGLGNSSMRKGMGLKLMEYRARVIDGTLNFRSRPKGGTMVTCRFPIQSEIRVSDYGL